MRRYALYRVPILVYTAFMETFGSTCREGKWVMFTVRVMTVLVEL